MTKHLQTRTLRSALTTLLALASFTISCSSSSIPRRDPVGEIFPAVAGESLDGKPWQIPGDLAGSPAILLIGFVQDSQFDIDRWLLGITQSETPVPFLELPTIKGLVPRMFKGTIDDGMRGGIPQEDWRGVVTLWADDSTRVIELTGNEKPRNARVLLLDAEGRVQWYADAGFSPRQMVELDTTARRLLQPAAGLQGLTP